MLDGLLGDAEAQAVRAAALILDEAGELLPARVGACRRRVPGTRGDRTLWLDGGYADRALDAVVELMEASRAVLNEFAFLGAGELEVQLAVYDQGNGYVRHRDTVRGRSDRRLTAIYYANDWRPGDGGELALYDAGGACTQVIEPIADRLVLFLAQTPHAVLPVARGPRVAVTAFMRR